MYGILGLFSDGVCAPADSLERLMNADEYPRVRLCTVMDRCLYYFEISLIVDQMYFIYVNCAIKI